jgi:hypothetical protein
MDDHSVNDAYNLLNEGLNAVSWPEVQEARAILRSVIDDRAALQERLDGIAEWVERERRALNNPYLHATIHSLATGK